MYSLLAMATAKLLYIMTQSHQVAKETQNKAGSAKNKEVVFFIRK